MLSTTFSYQSVDQRCHLHHADKIGFRRPIAESGRLTGVGSDLTDARLKTPPSVKCALTDGDILTSSSRGREKPC